MGLNIGIVGLPNVGKSTTFNALTKTQSAIAANYPFCTVEPNKAVVELKDKRVDSLAKLIKPLSLKYNTISFVDIAGLVKGASKGEGLGNKFLANIRECDVILHIVRCFEDDNITHVEGNTDPIRDIQIIENELLLADLETVDKKIFKLRKMADYDKIAKEDLKTLELMYKHLEDSKPLRSFSDKSNSFYKLDKELNFLSSKELMYALNVDENSLLEDNKFVNSVKEYTKDIELIKICAKVEEELIALEESEKEEFLRDLGISESGLEKIVRIGFSKLGLISYFTAGVKEVRAWTVKQGSKAPKAAAVIHNDFEKGFIRAEVISYDDFIKYGGENPSKEAGKMRLEGKDYVVNDGDIIHFRFNI